MHGANVHVGEWSMVHALEVPLEPEFEPFQPLNNHIIAFSPYRTKLLFYRSSGCSDVVRVLKNSLATALTYYYPLAGRVSSFKGSKTQFQLHHCNAGAAFLETSSDGRLDELLKNHQLPSKFTGKLCQLMVPCEYPWKEEYPLLHVQVTKFACGGVSLGVSFSHQICDGVGFWSFMKSWGEIARLGKPVVPPVMSYKFVAHEVDDEQADVLPMNMTLLPKQFLVQHLLTSGGGPGQGFKKLFVTTMTLSYRDILSLKSLAPGFTAFEVMSAYIWSRLSQTWSFGKDDTVAFQYQINCRERTSWITSNYFRNAVLPATVSASVGLVQGGSLSSLASLIHKTTATYSTTESVENGIRCLHMYDSNEEVMPYSNLHGCKNVVCVTGSPRHGNNVDFGWGRVSGSTIGSEVIDLGYTMVHMFPSAKGDGSVDVALGMNNSSTLKAFQEKGELLESMKRLREVFGYML